MDNDNGVVLLVVLGGAVIVWYFLGRKPAASGPSVVNKAPDPCYVTAKGVTVSCGAIEKGLKTLQAAPGAVAGGVLSLVGSSGRQPQSYADWSLLAETANREGIVYGTGSSFSVGGLKGRALPAGFTNVVVASASGYTIKTMPAGPAGAPPAVTAQPINIRQTLFG